MMQQTVIELSDIIGTSGRYQIIALFVATYANAFQGSFQVFIQLLAPDVDLYWYSDSSHSNLTIFKSSHCKLEDLKNNDRLWNHSESSSKLLYKSEYSDNTLTEQLELICENSWLVSLSKSVSQWGIFPGCLIFGVMCERFGRRPVSVLFLILAAGANICILFQKNFVWFCAGSFLYGGTVLPVCQSLMIEALEVIPTSRRAAYSTATRFGLMVGQMLLVGMLWLTRDWFYTQLLQVIYAVTTLLLACYLLESPMWLAVRDRGTEAKRNLITIAGRNKLKIEEVEPKIDLWVQQMKVQVELATHSEKGTVCDLFQNSVIARYTLFIWCVRLSCSFSYLGVTQNVQSFGSNLVEELMISSALAIGAGLATLLLLSRLSLRIISMGFLLLFGVSCIIYTLTFEHPLARAILSLLARMLIVSPLNSTFIYLAEVFPTSVRSIGQSMAATVCAIGSPISPFAKELGEMTSACVPFVLYAILSLLSIICLKFLPETKGRPLKHTVEELKVKN